MKLTAKFIQVLFQKIWVTSPENERVRELSVIEGSVSCLHGQWGVS